MDMNIRVELCHVDTLRCVVRVEAWKDAHLIGSSLGEAPTAEEAEDRAFQRLTERLESKNPSPLVDKPPVRAASSTSHAVSSELIRREAPTQNHTSAVTQSDPASKSSTSRSTSSSSSKSKSDAESDAHQIQRASQSALEPPSESPTDPDDWSEELTAIDFELKRIGWNRDQERQYLERAFGHGSRHRLTRYADLVAFLRQLLQIQPGESPDQCAVPIHRSDLISQGDQMLLKLGWTGEQARTFLQKTLNSISRQHLSDEQLLQLNMLLEEQILNNA